MIKVIGSALIKNDEGKYLALKLTKKLVGNSYVPPGGKLEDNETIRECVIRELREELNIDIEITQFEAVTEEKYDGVYWVFVMYGAKIINGTPTIMEPEKISEISWVDVSEFKNSKEIKWVK